ncbi:TerC family protein [Actinokineospora globicatena]|uniref:Tellurium resistance protein TerC n=1 Tax=Actinokineospora globicatena TaxID=103729 RepID=A0A9W6QNL7_9PSEU|nr:TerC family protein [Actinokineospora globicatena]MCP2304710.1 tellurite resistance protein TerC [Actinokineospora globicatena]GLW77915.1 tellurium resistance protein TerC [Actinokineospora globicatena]GLW85418.1 tellurium resistance protein TerC [Actinokineospora globicatena]GLW94171.1 tellurium resistance protein TerC [Actinokineospora globicatena]
MVVPTWAWFATIGGLLALLAIDLFIVDRKPHEVTVGEAGRWVAFYIGCAVAFGGAIWAFSGGTYAGEFFAGYITEYSLSVDNLFIFLIIMSAFSVPRIHQHKVLLIGIVLALVMRGAFIAVGAVAIAKFSWVFYLFGAFLIYTAWNLSRQGLGEDEEYEENALTKIARKIFPVTDTYHGANSFVRIDGKRFVTPMFIVMIAIGTADLLFAVDSIPAIFGLTKEPFLVFTANAFALMGLRQLYFLLGGLLKKLVYLSIGLAVILAFIGVKLVLEALHTNSLPFLNDGQPLPVPVPNIVVSLAVIVGVLAITTVASLLKSKRDEARGITATTAESTVLETPAGESPTETGEPVDHRR